MPALVTNGPAQALLELPGYRLADVFDQSVAALRQYEPPGGYYGAFSGGKDSLVIKQLAVEAGVHVEWHYHQTTIDPPELVRFIRNRHPDVIWDKPREHLLHRAVVKGLPTRRVRWCCQEYKESVDTSGRVHMVGVRAAESPRRAASWQTMSYTRAHVARVRRHWTLAPILRWEDRHVWDFIRDRHLPYCQLYDEGWKRLGCVGCPLSNRPAEFRRWPGFERLWLTAARRCWESRALASVTRFTSWDRYWDWWMGDFEEAETDECQMSLALSSGTE